MRISIKILNFFSCFKIVSIYNIKEHLYLYRYTAKNILLSTVDAFALCTRLPQTYL